MKIIYGINAWVGYSATYEDFVEIYPGMTNQERNICEILGNVQLPLSEEQALLLHSYLAEKVLYCETVEKQMAFIVDRQFAAKFTRLFRAIYSALLGKHLYLKRFEA